MNAGWLSAFSFVPERGYFFRWSRKGEQRVVLVRYLIDDFKLAADSGLPKNFTDACLHAPRSMESGLCKACRAFWLACLGELSLEVEADPLYTFVKIIEAADEDDVDFPPPVLELANLCPNPQLISYAFRDRKSSDGT
ncbi:MAG: hypothetical protein WED15_08380 [Akkermansiaceae bacterium]